MTEELVTVDFAQLDKMRIKIREIVKRVKETDKYAWSHSGFYIGRGVTRFTFYEINVNQFQMTNLLNEVANEFPDCLCYKAHRNLYVYLRGNPK